MDKVSPKQSPNLQIILRTEFMEIVDRDNRALYDPNSVSLPTPRQIEQAIDFLDSQPRSPPLTHPSYFGQNDVPRRSCAHH